MPNAERPNTGIDDVVLSKKVVLCCGEDWAELLRALERSTDESPLLRHEYRCYRVLKFQHFSLIWTGIGTGCLEPLLYELRASRVVEHIVMIGTAGVLSPGRVPFGEVRVVRQAFLGASAVSPTEETQLGPRFSEKLLKDSNLADAVVVSTDFYYGFSLNEDSAVLRQADKRLQDTVAKWLGGAGTADMVDMETAQFYYLCATLFSQTNFEYVAIRGAANSASAPAAQTMNSEAVLVKAMQASFVLLQLPLSPKAAQSTNSTPVPPAENGAKLMEEVKLFWMIQIAVCGVLGYLGTNLTINPPPPPAAQVLTTDALLKNGLIAVVAFFLLQIGSVMNVVGNYYARLAGAGPMKMQQENTITPFIAFCYLVISALVAAIGVRVGFQGGKETMCWAAIVGLLVNCLVGGAVSYGPLAKGSEDYRKYACLLPKVYLGVALLVVLLEVVLILSGSSCVTPWIS